MMIAPRPTEPTWCNRRVPAWFGATKRWGGGIAPLFLCSVVLLVVAAASNAQSPDPLYRRISTKLVQEALRIQPGRPGYWDVLERAWRIDPGNGDAQFLLAQRHLLQQRDQRIAEALLRDALTGDRTIDDSRVVATLSELLLRQGRYDHVISLVDSYYQGPYHDRLIEDRPDRVDIGYLTAYLQVGNPWIVGEYLRELRDRFPEHAELARIDFERSDRVSLSVLEWIDHRLRRGYDLPPSLILSAIIATRDEDLRYELSTLYFRSGGEDPLAAVPFMFTDNPENAPLIGAARGSLRHDKLALELVYRWYGDGSLERVLTEPVGTTTMIVDSDRDGFWEEQYTTVGKRLSGWSCDVQQDGVIDLRLEIAAGETTGGLDASERYGAFDARVFHSVDDGRERLVQVVAYAPYPNVAEVVRLRVSPSSTVEAMMRDEANPDRVEEALRWQPARPFAVPSIVEGPRRGGRWNAYTDRVRLDEEMMQRFDRQFESSNVRTIENEDIHGLLSEFAMLGLIPR